MIPPELKTILLLSLLNPGTILVGFLLGYYADEKAKLVVAAFGSGIGGAAIAAILTTLGIAVYRPSFLMGIFICSMVMGVFWGWLGYSLRRFAR